MIHDVHFKINSQLGVWDPQLWSVNSSPFTYTLSTGALENAYQENPPHAWSMIGRFVTYHDIGTNAADSAYLHT